METPFSILADEDGWVTVGHRRPPVVTLNPPAPNFPTSAMQSQSSTAETSEGGWVTVRHRRPPVLHAEDSKARARRRRRLTPRAGSPPGSPPHLPSEPSPPRTRSQDPNRYGNLRDPQGPSLGLFSRLSQELACPSTPRATTPCANRRPSPSPASSKVTVNSPLPPVAKEEEGLGKPFYYRNGQPIYFPFHPSSEEWAKLEAEVEAEMKVDGLYYHFTPFDSANFGTPPERVEGSSSIEEE